MMILLNSIWTDIMALLHARNYPHSGLQWHVRSPAIACQGETAKSQFDPQKARLNQ
jgi:hypothetical protein